MDEREMFVHFTGLFIKLIYCGPRFGVGLWSAAILSVPAAAAAAALTEPLLGHAKERCGGTRLRFVVITFACRLARRCGLRNREREREMRNKGKTMLEIHMCYLCY